MAQNQVYLIKSGENSFVEETQAIVGISGGKVGIGTTHPQADLHVTGNTQIDGHLTVKGNFTTVNETTIKVDDNNIELNSRDDASDNNADGGGITLKSSNGDKTFNWEEATSAWTSSENLSVANGKRITTEQIRALDADGLSITDDTGGVAIFIKDGGQVGIKTEDPGYDLEVNGSGYFSQGLYVNGNSVLTGTAADLGKWSGATNIYYTGGNVGIKNNNPEYPLHVSGDAAVDGNFIVNGTSGNLNVSELNVSGDYINVNYLNEALYSNRGGLQVHHSNGTGKLEYLSDSDHWQFNKKLQVLSDLDIGGSGNIGGDLTIVGNLRVNGTTTTVNTEELFIKDHNIVIASNIDHTQLTNDHPDGTNEYAGILWGTGDGRPSLTYQSNKGFSFDNGNVGIGTTDPGSKLTIEDGDIKLQRTDAGNSKIIFSNTGNDTWAVAGDADGDFSIERRVKATNAFINRALTIESVATEAMRIDSDGKVGIGTTDPDYSLDVPGTGNFGTLYQNESLVVTEANLGTAPNQIPLNKDLGTLAYQDAVNLDDVSADMLELRAIAAEISDSAVDVFVYDTSRDSDGGAWRKRTQHTSWYNEELNTETRGARREFPAVAVIVAEADKVTIYDGDDPDMSMWMVFESETGSFSYIGIDPQSRPCTSCWALNGVMCIGSRSSTVYGGYLVETRFLSDSGMHYGVDLDGSRKIISTIAERNLNTLQVYRVSDEVIINSHINDVAMTVLPNAPIDEDTGLPVPTIAVATDGGVSVIKDDGSVVDINAGTGYTTDFVSFLYADNKWTVLYKATSAGVHRIRDFYNKQLTNFYNTGGDIRILGNSQVTNSMIVSDDSNIEIGQTLGLNKINSLDRSFDSGSLITHITSKYNTGWMPGDIKLATLSDTTIGATTELITNGDFSKNVTASDGQTSGGWTAGASSDISIDSGRLKVLQQISASAYGYQLFKTQPGKKYILTADFERGANVGAIKVSSNDGSWTTGNLYNTGYINTSFVDATFTATTSGTYIAIQSYGAQDGYVFVDNISVRATTELITNGDFSTDANAVDFANTYTDWTAYNAAVSVTGGRLKIDDSEGAGDWSSAVQKIDTVIGKKYILSVEYFAETNNGIIGYYNGSYTVAGTALSSTNYIEQSSSGTYTIEFTATNSITSIFLGVNGTGISYFDNVSVRPAEEDRSVNGNGLQIFGEINKTRVAPGADLVAYSGFSANDYLVQPYNEDLDFTDTMSIMLWVKDVTGNFNPIERGTRYIDHSYGLYLKDVYGHIRFYYSVDGTTNQQVEIVGGASLIQSGWHHVAVCASQGKIKMYVDGKLLSTADQVGNFYSQSTNKNGLKIGVGSITNSSDHPITLLRISKTAPTDTQIAKIYRDEKALFQDGAQATLYGTSDAVTALAYDDSNQLLHVGTASGRSDFRGLVRVNNTTTAISNSISAAEGTIIQN